MYSFYENLTYEELIERYKKERDEEIFDVLYRKILAYIFTFYEKRIYGAILDDFITEIEVPLIKAIENYDSSKAKFTTYLSNFLIRKFINFTIKRARMKRDYRKEVSLESIKNKAKINDEKDSEFYIEEMGYCENYDFIDIETDLSKILRKNMLDLLCLKLQGYSNREIAEILGVGLSTVWRWNRIMRGILHEYFAIGRSNTD